MGKVRVLLIGAAFSADLHAEGYARCGDIAELVAICDKDTNRVKTLADRYGFKDYAVYDDMFKAIEEVDCDVVDICLPNFLHHDAALAAFKKGRHVISEKPLATTVEDAKEMLDAAEAAGKKLYYAEDWLFAPALNRALEVIDEGAIGKPMFVRARECHNGSHSPFAQTIKFCGGGSMVHLGVHPVCFMLALKNNRWTEVVAMTSGGGENNLRHKTMEGEDWGAALMRFEDGTTALLEANYVSEGGMEDVIDFYGDQGCLHVDLTFSSALNLFSIPGAKYTVEKADITTGWSKPAVDEKFNLGYVNEIRHFMESARDNKDAKVGLRGIDGYEAIRVINLIYKSAREGVAVKNDRL
ncbi:MAG: Gfo/Idh/MocA family oxidoreductase [Oscillospiraceae bacterium]|nr:Gfo/Idh/MocA family oxidoreductase [Oscillospiraceae bacterium]MBQ4544875.1 Gfo/Idh/MocA family oxidoreductase [Oscillospiraceae bacterium]MBQ6901550.1 Gfo/Idh/MocA family oxidoreductase [Oscillospiraceae bacterium]